MRYFPRYGHSKQVSKFDAKKRLTISRPTFFSDVQFYINLVVNAECTNSNLNNKRIKTHQSISSLIASKHASLVHLTTAHHTLFYFNTISSQINSFFKLSGHQAVQKRKVTLQVMISSQQQLPQWSSIFTGPLPTLPSYLPRFKPHHPVHQSMTNLSHIKSTRKKLRVRFAAPIYATRVSGEPCSTHISRKTCRLSLSLSLS